MTNEERRKRERVRARAVLLDDTFQLVDKLDAGAPLERIVSTALDVVEAARRAPERLIGMERVRELVPYSRTHIWRLVKARDFPEPVRVGPNRVAWREDEVLEWRGARRAEGGAFSLGHGRRKGPKND